MDKETVERRSKEVLRDILADGVKRSMHKTLSRAIRDYESGLKPGDWKSGVEPNDLEIVIRAFQEGKEKGMERDEIVQGMHNAIDAAFEIRNE